MVVSVKSIMNCIGVDTSGSVSILGDLFGFFRRRVPADPCSLFMDPSAAHVSLLDHIKSLKGKHIHLNIIRVGIDNFTNEEVDGIDYAIYQARKIYRMVNLGIGRVEHHDIISANAHGHDNLGCLPESEDLIREETIPNNGLDVFMVRTISDPLDWYGNTPLIPGPCDKGEDDDGLIGGRVDRLPEEVARTFSHEIGHYLGLYHNHDDHDSHGNECTIKMVTPPCCPDTPDECNNLMASTKCANACGGGVCEAITLTNSQGITIRSHCIVQDGC
jgi:hypothetical protein